MNGWPPWADIDWMLTIEPAIFSRRMIFAVSWIRKNGARTLTLKISLKRSSRRVENIAAIGEAGGVDEHVDAFEAAIGFGDHLAAIGDASKIGA